ncbi:hypothetical protein N7452_003241 [Penicillium brevicompactum]|uniref:Uncharacterized protein n=1 Tax=Penicillium brevicompactum TaxID=5074 RepID=A0A9W9QZ41_PENBR|nr:hypothetical protein N7452_003241 [Penicillium brevicompactum]
MSKLLEDDEPKSASCDYDQPPQYDSCQQRPDLLTSVVENEMAYRENTRNLTEWNKHLIDWSNNAQQMKRGDAHRHNKRKSPDPDLAGSELREMAGILRKVEQSLQERADLLKERSNENSGLYTAMSSLSPDEFERTYSSVKRDGFQQARTGIFSNIASMERRKSLWAKLRSLCARPGRKIQSRP